MENIVKCYGKSIIYGKHSKSYRMLRRRIRSRQHDLITDGYSIGQYNTGRYSADITLREYDGTWCIDFDIYDIAEENELNRHKDGGKICTVKEMPLTERGFWNLVKEKVINFIQNMK